MAFWPGEGELEHKFLKNSYAWVVAQEGYVEPSI